MAHTELDLRERRVIEDMLNAKMSVRKIAVEIGRYCSMVHRDNKRNGYVDEERFCRKVFLRLIQSSFARVKQPSWKIV